MELQEILKTSEEEILTGWLKEMSTATRRADLMSDEEVKREAAKLMRQITAAWQASHDLNAEAWVQVSDSLANLARTRMEAGFSPVETAMFVLSLKKPVFEILQKQVASDPEKLVSELWIWGDLMDRLAMKTVSSAVEYRDRIISRQQEDMMELSTPVVKLWDGILALPLIGTLDSARTQVVMESLLSAIVETNSQVAIIDITGVPTVDTLVAQHLIKTITAARLMGADCYLSGIRPAIAQIIVHLGIDLADIQTKAKLSDAFSLALQRMGKSVVSAKTLRSSGSFMSNSQVKG